MNAEQFDNELFNLSQKAANDSLAPFNEVAWQRMEQLLDADKKKRRFILWWWLLPVMLIGSALFFYIVGDKTTANKNFPKTNNSHKLLNIQTEKSVQKKNNATQTTANNTHDKLINATQNDLQNYSLAVIKNNKSPIKNTTKNSANTKIVIGKKIVEHYKNNTTVNTVIPNIIDDEKPSSTGKIEDVQTNKITKQTTIIAANIKENTVIETKQNRSETNNPLGLDSSKKSSNSVTTIVPVLDTAIFKKGIVTDSISKKSLLSKFMFSVFVNNDITTIKFKNIDKVSTSFGIGVAYAISKKLSVATGFAIGRKLYKADSVDYVSMPLWRNPMYKLNNITANCLVYEVPVNLQYQFKQSNKNSWLAVVGLSNYYMISESYDYNYGTYGQTLKTNYLVKNKNNHLLSILNLGVSYRRQFSNKLSYQLTPYLKVPLTGIGAGKVNLYSAGLQLAINFKGK